MKIICAIKGSGSYTTEQLEVISYGLESIYILITKLVVISIAALVLGIFKEYLIFLLIYNIIRVPSFGLHASKSWMCWISSSLIFLLIPFIAKVALIPVIIKSLIGCICIILVFKNAPADTEKRPIINKQRRLTFKYISVVIAIAMVLTSIISKNLFISNSFLFALITQCFMISPLIYRLFNLKYNNYLNYQTSISN